MLGDVSNLSRRLMRSRAKVVPVLSLLDWAAGDVETRPGLLEDPFRDGE